MRRVPWRDITLGVARIISAGGHVRNARLISAANVPAAYMRTYRKTGAANAGRRETATLYAGVQRTSPYQHVAERFLAGGVACVGCGARRAWRTACASFFAVFAETPPTRLSPRHSSALWTHATPRSLRTITWGGRAALLPAGGLLYRHRGDLLRALQNMGGGLWHAGGFMAHVPPPLLCSRHPGGVRGGHALAICLLCHPAAGRLLSATGLISAGGAAIVPLRWHLSCSAYPSTFDG